MQEHSGANPAEKYRVQLCPEATHLKSIPFCSTLTIIKYLFLPLNCMNEQTNFGSTGPGKSAANASMV